MEDEQQLEDLTQNSSISNEIPIPETPKQVDQVVSASRGKKISIFDELFSGLGNFIVALKVPLMNIVTWLGFCVLIALTPIIASWLVSGVVEQPYSLELTLGHGELFAISIALAGEALQYLLTNPHANDISKRFVGIGCAIVLLSSAMLLGVLSVNKLHINAKYVTHASLISFSFTLVIGCFCKWKDI
jgi:hypothetical protein